MRSKIERRQYYRSLQSSFTAEQYKIWNEALAKSLKPVMDQFPRKSVVAAYQSMTKEAQLHSIFSQDLKFCFPKVTSKKMGEMEFREVPNAKDNSYFETGAYDILEPKAKCKVIESANIDICLVPLLAFDGEGRRLGQGKGFYDRFLAKFKGKRIGIAFEWQYSPMPLPIEETDQVLDMVITEHCVRSFK